MILRGIDFGRVWGASGVQSFYGEGYWYHKYLKKFGLDFEDMTLVTKTATRYPRLGNIELDAQSSPIELFPDTIKVYPYKGLALNALGMTNPGIENILKSKVLRSHEKPFFISIALTGDSINENVDYAEMIYVMIDTYRHKFKSQFGLQLNYSCPNIKNHNTSNKELNFILNYFSHLNIPIVLKFSIDTRPEVV